MKKININIIRVGLILILSAAMATASFARPPVKPPLPQPQVIHIVQINLPVLINPDMTPLQTLLMGMPGVLNVVPITEQNLLSVTYDLRLIAPEMMRIALMQYLNADVLLGMDVAVRTNPGVVLPPVIPPPFVFPPNI